MYRQSKYNYILEKAGDYCIYNTLYGGIIILDSAEYQLLKNGSAKKEIYSETEKFFIENGFWIDDSVNETEQYLKCCKFMKEHRHNYVNAVIAVTTECNARCFYCFEKGVKQRKITKESADKIISQLKEKHEINKALGVTWYGGEPLMNQEIISYLTKELRKIYDDYSASMITNGFLFDDETIEKAVYDWKISVLQITLDGTEAEYNARKNYINPNVSPFRKVIENIKKIAEHNISISLRLNVDDDNFYDILDLLEFLRNEFAGIKNIYIYPAVITKNNFMSDSTPEERTKIYMDKIFSDFGDIVNISNLIENQPKINACMLDDANAFAFGTNGDLYLCEHYIDKEDYLYSRLEKILMPEIVPECYDCNILPKCFGGCYANRTENNIYCSIEKYYIDTYLKNRLK